MTIRCMLHSAIRALLTVVIVAIPVPTLDVVERLSKIGMDPATSTPEEFARTVASDYAKWGPVVKASGFAAD